MNFIGLILAAVVIEGIVGYAQLFIKDGKFQWQNIVAIVLGILISLTYQLDLFAIVGISAKIPYVGMVLTGILLSRGSNYISDVIKLLRAFKEQLVLKNENLRLDYSTRLNAQSSQTEKGTGSMK